MEGLRAVQVLLLCQKGVRDTIFPVGQMSIIPSVINKYLSGFVLRCAQVLHLVASATNIID